MNTLGKVLVGSVAAVGMTVASAAPAMARDGDGIGAGEIIAGALVIGGIAAIAASAGDRGNDYDYGRDWRDGSRNDRNWSGMSARRAVDQCVRTAENRATRGTWGRADVTDVRKVERTRHGYEVRGRIAVNTRGRAWRHGDGDYGRGWQGDYRGWNSGMRGYDSGRFECRVEYGRVTRLNFSGIRGL